MTTGLTVKEVSNIEVNIYLNRNIQPWRFHSLTVISEQSFINHKPLTENHLRLQQTNKHCLPDERKSTNTNFHINRSTIYYEVYDFCKVIKNKVNGSIINT